MPESSATILKNIVHLDELEPPEKFEDGDESEEDPDDDHCSICLQLITDRTVLPDCAHEFCFECIITWSDQSRRCPLCTQTIGDYVIHHVRSKFDFQKHHLVPLRSSPPPINPLRPAQSRRRIHARQREWGRRRPNMNDVADAFERAVDKRRWVYQNHLYVRHVASNSFTRYRPCPSPEQFAKSQDLISKATIFIRRELQVWVNLDVEFLTTFVISLLKAIDIRSETSVKLLAEFLDMDRPYSEFLHFPNAEHFAHELYSYLRSPFKTLAAYDAHVQYGDTASNISEVERRPSEEALQRSTRNRYHQNSGRNDKLRRSDIKGPEDIRPDQPYLMSDRGKFEDSRQRSKSPSVPTSIPGSSVVVHSNSTGKARAVDSPNQNDSLTTAPASEYDRDDDTPLVQLNPENPASNHVTHVEGVEIKLSAEGSAESSSTLTSGDKFKTSDGNPEAHGRAAPKSLRIKQPLLIAQGYLLKAGSSRPALDHQRLLEVTNGPGKPHLLSRISTGTKDTPDPVSEGGSSRSAEIQLNISSDCSQDGGVDNSTGVALSVRARLKERLGLAKADVLDTVPQNPEDRLDSNIIHMNEIASESKLHQQARLRAKLESERRQAAAAALDTCSDLTTKKQSDVGISIECAASVGMVASNQDVGREGVLKALLGRRKEHQQP